MDYAEMSLEELEERAADGDLDAAEELQRREGGGEAAGEQAAPGEAQLDRQLQEYLGGAYGQKGYLTLFNTADKDPYAALTLARILAGQREKSDREKCADYAEKAKDLLEERLASGTAEAQTKDVLAEALELLGSTFIRLSRDCSPYDAYERQKYEQNAFAAFQNLAELDDRPCAGLGVCLLEGIGTAADRKEGRRQLLRAATKGSLEEKLQYFWFVCRGSKDFEYDLILKDCAQSVPDGPGDERAAIEYLLAGEGAPEDELSRAREALAAAAQAGGRWSCLVLAESAQDPEEEKLLAGLSPDFTRSPLLAGEWERVRKQAEERLAEERLRQETAEREAQRRQEEEERLRRVAEAREAQRRQEEERLRQEAEKREAQRRQAEEERLRQEAEEREAQRRQAEERLRQEAEKREAQRRQEEEARVLRSAEYRMEQAWSSYEEGDPDQAREKFELTLQADDIRDETAVSLAAAYMLEGLKGEKNRKHTEALETYADRSPWICLALAALEEDNKQKKVWAANGVAQRAPEFPASRCREIRAACKKKEEEERILKEKKKEEEQRYSESRSRFFRFTKWYAVVVLAFVIMVVLSGRKLFALYALFACSGIFISNSNAGEEGEQEENDAFSKKYTVLWAASVMLFLALLII